MKQLAGTQTTLSLLVRATQCSFVGAVTVMESMRVCSLAVVLVAVPPSVASVCAQLSSTLNCDFALKTLLSAEILKMEYGEIRASIQKFKIKDQGRKPLKK